MFDIDGTLVDSYERGSEIYSKVACDVLGIPELSTRWSEYRHVTDSGITSEVLQRHGGEPHHAEHIQRRFIDELAAATADVPMGEVPGARALLAHLHDNPQTQPALATGAWKEAAVQKLGQAAFDADGLPMATSDDADARTEIMLVARERAAQAAGVAEFESITYVGDAVWDVHASRELGWAFIGRSCAERIGPLRELGVEHIVPHFGDRPAFLRTWEAARCAG
jgi:phosphoglycolate phosphatase-like HAD superfamily hydrolase